MSYEYCGYDTNHGLPKEEKGVIDQIMREVINNLTVQYQRFEFMMYAKTEKNTKCFYAMDCLSLLINNIFGRLMDGVHIDHMRTAAPHTRAAVTNFISQYDGNVFQKTFNRQYISAYTMSIRSDTGSYHIAYLSDKALGRQKIMFSALKALSIIKADDVELQEHWRIIADENSDSKCFITTCAFVENLFNENKIPEIVAWKKWRDSNVTVQK